MKKVRADGGQRLMLSLSVYKPIAIQILPKGRPPICERGVELGGRVLYPVKLLHIRYNLFAGTEMLSLSPLIRAKRNTNFAWGDRPPIWGKGWS